MILARIHRIAIRRLFWKLLWREELCIFTASTVRRTFDSEGKRCAFVGTLNQLGQLRGAGNGGRLTLAGNANDDVSFG